MANIETITVGENTYNILAMSQVSYSTTEQNTGLTWVDGKPIYQETISVGALPNNTSKTSNIQSLNVDRTINLFGFAMNPSNGNMRPIPFSSGNSSDNIRVGVNQRNSIDINTYTSWSGYTETYITIQYTKTTD